MSSATCGHVAACCAVPSLQGLPCLCTNAAVAFLESSDSPFLWTHNVAWFMRPCHQWLWHVRLLCCFWTLGFFLIFSFASSGKRFCLMLKCVWIFCPSSKVSVLSESFSGWFQPKLMRVETSSYCFHGLCDKGPLDRREESWSNPMAAGKTPVTLPFIRHWKIYKGKSCWQPNLFPSDWNYGFIPVCASMWPFVWLYFWRRELLDTILCFSAPHLLLQPRQEKMRHKGKWQ